MIVYQTNHQGYYVGEVEADESPLEPGVFLIPGGAVETPPPALNDNESARWVGNQWIVEVEPAPEPTPEPTPEELAEILRLNIMSERNRRMRDRVWFQGNLYDSDDGSLQRITGAATLAGFAMGQGAQAGNYFWHGGSQPFAWITADNGLTLMDAPTMFDFGRRAAEHESLHIFAARALKDMNPPPADYTNDAYWPPLIPEQEPIE